MFKKLRKLYNWILLWSNSPYGIYALFTLSFFESIIFPIPPDVLLIALAISSRSKAYKFAFICSLGSVLGAMLGYLIGNYLWWGAYGVSDFFLNYINAFSEDSFRSIKSYYDEYGFLIIITAGFTPLPYKLITISAGAFNISFSLFIIASTLSRSARFYLLSFLIKRYGRIINIYIDKYFNILSILLMIILIVAYILIKYLI
jgi:membrane protein YqaA with SNARE-associated domain